MKLIFTIIFVVLICLTACSDTNDSTNFAETIEQAHQKSAFSNKPALSFDFVMYAGGNKQMEATYTATPDLSKIKMVVDSVTVIYDGQKVYQSPANADFKRARFHVLTWPYFLTMPFKLTDPGTRWEEFSPDSLNRTHYPAQKLTFDPGTGDTPDDWYVVYKDPKTNRLHAAGYIVTYGKSKEEAEEEPHAIRYKTYKSFDGIPLSTEWELTTWDKNKGLGKTLSKVSIRNIQFLRKQDDRFNVPDSAKTVPLNF